MLLEEDAAMVPPNLIQISATAAHLLHRHKPGQPAYLSWALGPPRNAEALTVIDDAYSELVEAGLMEAQETTMLVLPGVSRSPLVLTREGEQTRRT
jgi:hypothetical protein